MDRNCIMAEAMTKTENVALRKESVDRNPYIPLAKVRHCESLSARRAWIEIASTSFWRPCPWVALRKESVDRNVHTHIMYIAFGVVALRKESVDRNMLLLVPELVPWVALRKESVDRNVLGDYHEKH